MSRLHEEETGDQTSARVGDQPEPAAREHLVGVSFRLAWIVGDSSLANPVKNRNSIMASPIQRLLLLHGWLDLKSFMSSVPLASAFSNR